MTIKIYELAKELNIASKELVEKINTMGIEAKSHMSSIDDKVAAELRNTLGGKHVANSETKVVKAVPKKKEKDAFSARIESVQRFTPQPMTVDEAVKELESSGEDFVGFLNEDTGVFQLVHKKGRGYGLLEPRIS